VGPEGLEGREGLEEAVDKYDDLGVDIAGDTGSTSSISSASVSSVFILLRFQASFQTIRSTSDIDPWSSPLGSTTPFGIAEGGSIVPTVKESSASNRS
jgi:hypothetical protein